MKCSRRGESLMLFLLLAPHSLVGNNFFDDVTIVWLRYTFHVNYETQLRHFEIGL